jgi:uncharacterized repeat protein (TIGR03803 family)
MKGSRYSVSLAFALACAAITFSLTVSAQAQTVADLANFNGQTGDGPFGSVMQATDGRFYGTTVAGGIYRSGDVFEVTSGGDLRVLYSFCAKPVSGECTDGANSLSAPVLASDGNLYGVTSAGGSNAGDLKGGDTFGSGTVYKLTLGGKLTTLYTFCPSLPCIDGRGPNGLIQASDGNFYGTTSDGGRFKEGTIFKVTPSGKYTVLYSFCALANCRDGELPTFPPLQGIDGNFYGTAAGGASGAGVVYELNASGTFTVLYNFCNYGSGHCPGGSVPTNIVQDAHGNLFGTTEFGGSSETGENAGYGVVFEITPTNQYIVLQSFDFNHQNPTAGLILANDGNLYGVNQGSGRNGGSIVAINPAGGVTPVYTFGECDASGYNPSGSLFQGTDGNLYGMNAYGGGGDGGCGGYGTIYSVSNGLSPLVETSPAAGKVGQSVIILGNGLTGTSSVTFNGVAAAFTVKSDTYIKATVPMGAITGTVSVVTPTGTLNSNPQFVVTK